MSSRNKPDRKTSALSELDSKLDQLRNGGLELESITPAEVHADLLSGLWWRACAEAVTEQPERLLGWYRGTDDEIGDLFRGQAGSVEAGEVGLAVARAIAAVGVVSASAVGRVSPGDAEQAVSVAVSAWSKANLLTDTSLDETAAHVGDDASPALPAMLAGAQGMVNSLAYNRSGTMAITVSDDDTATGWNVVDAGKPAVLARLVGHKSSVAAGLFSAEGGTVITGSTDGSVITWNIEVLTSITRDPRPTACEVAHGAFTPEEWPTWVSPEVPYVNNC